MKSHQMMRLATSSYCPRSATTLTRTSFPQSRNFFQTTKTMLYQQSRDDFLDKRISRTREVVCVDVEEYHLLKKGDENENAFANYVGSLDPGTVVLETCPARWKEAQRTIAAVDKHQNGENGKGEISSSGAFVRKTAAQSRNNLKPQMDAINTLLGGLLTRDLEELALKYPTEARKDSHDLPLLCRFSARLTPLPCDRGYRQTQSELARALFLRPWLLPRYARYARNRLTHLATSRYGQEQENGPRTGEEKAGDPSKGPDGAVIIRDSATNDEESSASSIRAVKAESEEQLAPALKDILVDKRARLLGQRVRELSSERGQGKVVVCCATREFRRALERELEDLGRNSSDAHSETRSRSIAGSRAGPLWPFLFAFIYLILPASLFLMTILSVVKGCILGASALVQYICRSLFAAST
ncbi:unnamed protein product [Amoebophrya sp. A25]|nr:unnamed protein product [Amoebophrya sp. A25]|eukprot:GSA25T00003850001.1